MKEKHANLLKLLPLLIPFTLLFLGGSLFALLQSFGLFNPLKAAGGPMAPYQPLAPYRKLLSSPWFYRSLFFSLYVSLSSASLSVLVGTLLATIIWRLPPGSQKFAIVYKLPLILPHIAVAFIVLMLFSRTGLFSALLFQLGVISRQEEFPSILFGGNGLGIIIAYIFKEVPFVVLMVSGILKKFDARHITTARMLGASRRATFFRIILPFLLPVINTSFIILFLYSFGAFDIPFILSESSPEMLSIFVYNLYFQRDLANKPYAMAVLVFMLCFSALFIYLYSGVVSRLEAEERKL